ncbi:site-2 protease family protein [Porticoccaceae bacterium LTM1]|nr:site-2 protease family protein [Porticoccaceae bacterium LTM1]
MECSRCQLESTVESGFTRNDKNELLCPICFKNSVSKRARIVWLLVLVGIPVGYWLEISFESNFFLALLLISAWAYALQFISIALHELGHWAVARLTGGVCPIVEFGEGEEIFSWNTKNTIWRLKTSPTLGLAYCAYPAYKRQVWRNILMLSAGFLVNLLICLLSVYIFIYGLDVLSIEPKSLFWLVCALVNGALFFCSIYPQVVRQALKSDGMRILDIFRSTPDSVVATDGVYYSTIVTALISRNRFGELQDFVFSCRNYQESPVLLIALSYAYYIEGKFEEFLVNSEAALQVAKDAESKDGSDQSKVVLAICENNYAFSMYCKGSRDDKKMLELSQRAFRQIPWENSVVGTYAVILIRTSFDVEEGVKLLEKIKKEEERQKVIPAQLAMTYVGLCEGYQKLGNLASSSHALEEAKRLDENLVNSLMANMPLLNLQN